MKLRELRTGNESAWITPAKEYWDTEIHNRCVSEGWTNEDEMKTSARGYIDDLQTTYIAYKSGADVNSLQRALLPIYGYISMKYNMNVSGDPPTIPEIVTDDDIRNFYINWTVDIPDKENLFTLEEEDEEKGKVVLTSTYSNFKSTIEGGVSSDSSGLIAIETSLAGNVRPFMINQLYAQPETTSNNINIKQFALTNMHLQDVLDEFSFSIKGINS